MPIRISDFSYRQFQPTYENFWELYQETLQEEYDQFGNIIDYCGFAKCFVEVLEVRWNREEMLSINGWTFSNPNPNPIPEIVLQYNQRTMDLSVSSVQFANLLSAVNREIQELFGGNSFRNYNPEQYLHSVGRIFYKYLKPLEFNITLDNNCVVRIVPNAYGLDYSSFRLRKRSVRTVRNRSNTKV